MTQTLAGTWELLLQDFAISVSFCFCFFYKPGFKFSADVEMKYKDSEPYLENILHGSIPAVIHGNGPAKTVLNSLGNYLAKSWNTNDQVRVLTYIRRQKNLP